MPGTEFAIVELPGKLQSYMFRPNNTTFSPRPSVRQYYLSVWTNHSIFKYLQIPMNTPVDSKSVKDRYIITVLAMPRTRKRKKELESNWVRSTVFINEPTLINSNSI